MIYAVDEHGNHRVVCRDHMPGTIPGYPTRKGERLVEADAEGWVQWYGLQSDSPVPAESECRVRLSEGTTFTIIDPEDWDWSIGGDQWIAAYRPKLDAEGEPQAPEWGGEGRPPIGTPVRIKHRDLDPRVIPEVAGYHDGMVIICVGPDFDDYEAHTEHDLEPTRSEEDEAVERMLVIMEHATEQIGDIAHSTQLAEGARALYRAGLRFPGESS